MPNLFDFINDINHGKEDLFKEEDAEKAYVPFLINRGLSFSVSTIMYSNEMNRLNHLDKKLQYDFLRLAIPKQKRYNKWEKKDKLDNELIEQIAAHYKYSRSRALEVLSILTEEQITILKNKMNVGGRK